jgi:glycosyltransferase involved in cell wall biosynthesis
MIRDYVEVCVLTYNRIEFVSACLSSIINHTKTPTKIFVIDNGSTDGTVEYLTSLLNKNLIHDLECNTENQGIAKPKNRFLEKVEFKSDFIIMTDSDIVFPYTKPCWLEQYNALFERYPELGMLSLNFDSVNVADDTQWWFAKHKEGHRKKNDDLIILDAGFWGTAISKKTIDRIKTYNKEKYLDDVFRCKSLYGETDEMLRQALKENGFWCGIAKNIVGYNLGWDDNKKFKEYHMFKKIERSKAEQKRKEG